MRCKVCGQRLPDDAKRCPICKTEFTQEEINEALKASEEEKHSFRNWAKSREDSWNNMTESSETGSSKAGPDGSWGDSSRDSEKSSYSESYYGSSSSAGGNKRDRSDNSSVPDRNRPFAMASFLCGIASLILFMFVPSFSMGLSIAGLLSGIKGLNSSRKGRAIAGIVLSIAAFLAAVCYQILTNALSGKVDWDAFMTDLEKYMSQTQ